jgi:uroporphyrinogen decarboxylase
MQPENDLLLRAYRKEQTERRPVWIMRQAGRYLPSYRKVRERADFFTLCQTPDLVAEVSVQPVDQIGVDAAIIFSDILVIPQAMGMELEMVSGTGPVFHDPIRSHDDADRLKSIGAEELQYVFDGVSATRTALGGRVPVIGFAGSPWTLLTYMVEGQTSKNFRIVKELIYNDPAFGHRLLARLADIVGDYLAGQAAAGADALQIFDSWGGVLPPALYREFSLAYITRAVERMRAQAAGRTEQAGREPQAADGDGAPESDSAPEPPVVLFSRGVHHSLAEQAGSGVTALGVDWTFDLGRVREATEDRVALQGNLDPCMLYADEDRIRREVRAMLASFGSDPGYVVNLGHGILPDTDPEKARSFVRAVKEESAG